MCPSYPRHPIKADKGHTMIVIERDIYIQKVSEFINKNNIGLMNKDPSDLSTNAVNSVIKQYTSLFDDRIRSSINTIYYAPVPLNLLPSLKITKLMSLSDH